MTINNKSIGQRIQRRREYLEATRGEGYTRDDMALRLNLTRSGYAHWELGRRSINAPDLAKIAQILEVSAAYFLEDAAPAIIREDAIDYNTDEPVDEEEGQVLMYYRKIPPMMQARARAVLKAFVDEDEDYEEGKVYGKKAE